MLENLVQHMFFWCGALYFSAGFYRFLYPIDRTEPFSTVVNAGTPYKKKLLIVPGASER